MATTAPGSKAPEQERPADDSPAGQALTGRAVIWAGLAAGTAITVLAVLHGIRVPGLQVVLSVLATWALLVIGAITAAELLRRHHRALARHAARHGKRGALFAARHGRRGALAAGRGARRGSRSAAGYLTRKAAARWQNREHRPLLFTRHSGPRAADAGGHRGPGTAGRHRAGAAPTVRHRPWCRIFSTRRENHHGRHDHQRRHHPGPAAARRPDHAGAPGPAHRGPDRRGHAGRMGRGDRPGR